MAGILKRFKDVMSANFEKKLEKCEKPDKMIDYYLNNLEKELGEVNSETAKVIALKKGAERRVEEAQKNMAAWQGYADAAVLKGNDEDALTFLGKVSEAEKQLESLTAAAGNAADNAARMSAMHEKIMSDMIYLRAQRDALLTQYTVSQTMQSMNGITDGYETKAASSINGFNKMKEKIIFEMDKAEAAEEISKSASVGTAEVLREKYLKPDRKLEELLVETKKRLGVAVAV